MNVLRLFPIMVWIHIGYTVLAVIITKYKIFMFICLDKRVFDPSCNRTFRAQLCFFRIVDSILLFQLNRVMFTTKLNPTRINKKGKF